jgi:hypothetical protein
MRISLWTPESPLPGRDAWERLGDLLSEHDWVDARYDNLVEVDLQVVLLPPADQMDALDGVPLDAALFVVPDASTFRAWAGRSHRALGFACFSDFTAGVIRQTQVAPCTVLARNPLDGFHMEFDVDSDGGVSILLPGGDLTSALIVSRWLREFRAPATEIRILGPFTADALHELHKSARTATASVVLRSHAEDDEVAELIARSSRVAFVDQHPEAEVSAYLWESARRGVPTFVLGAGAYAFLPPGAVTSPASVETFARDLDSFIHGDQTAFAHQIAQARALAEQSHGRDDFVRTVDDAIQRATAFRPFEEAVNSVRLNLAHRGLSGPAVQRAAAASLDWMLGQQPPRGTSAGGLGR